MVFTKELNTLLLRLGGVSAKQVIYESGQPQKADPPIVEMEFPRVTFVSLEQLAYLQLFVYQLILIKTVEKRLCRFYRG